MPFNSLPWMHPNLFGCGEDGAPCNGATPEESSIRETRTYGSMRGLRS